MDQAHSTLAALRLSPVWPLLGLARRLARRLLAATPVRAAASPVLRRHRGQGTGLLYHRVHTAADGVAAAGDGGATWGNAGLSVEQGDFDHQIGWLAGHCRCLAADEAVEGLAKGILPRDAVLVTFDDGYRDNLEHALPVLERHGVPATLFVSPGLVDAARPPWWQELESLLAALGVVEVELGGHRKRWPLGPPWRRSLVFDRLAAFGRSSRPADLERMMEGIRDQAGPRPAAPNPMLTWEELRLLARHPLVTLGAHTLSHPPLAVLPEAEARCEIEESRRLLAERTGATVDHFAYPFGSRAQVGIRESDLVAAAGFRSAFTALEGHIQPEHARHPFLLPRFPITRRDGIDGLRFKLSGWRALLENRRQRVVTI